MDTKILSEELEELFKLHELRKTVKELREEGRISLESVDFDFIKESRKEDYTWVSSGDNVEIALISKIQSHRDIGNTDKVIPKSSLTEELNNITLADLFQTQKKPEMTVPVLIAARTMQSLVSRSSTCLSKTTMFCYYRILRELYSADSPDWIVGGQEPEKAVRRVLLSPVNVFVLSLLLSEA